MSAPPPRRAVGGTKIGGGGTTGRETVPAPYRQGLRVGAGGQASGRVNTTHGKKTYPAVCKEVVPVEAGAAEYRWKPKTVHLSPRAVARPGSAQTRHGATPHSGLRLDHPHVPPVHRVRVTEGAPAATTNNHHFRFHGAETRNTRRSHVPTQQAISNVF